VAPPLALSNGKGKIKEKRVGERHEISDPPHTHMPSLYGER